MGDWELLFLVLGAIYLSECVVWIPRGTVALASIWGRRYSPRAPIGVLGNSRGGFVLAFPLPPFGSVLHSRGFPFSVSGEGVLSFVSASLDPNGRVEETVRFVAFEGLAEGSIKAREKWLMIDGARFVSCGSDASARHWAGVLRSIAAAKPRARVKVIEEAIAASMDTAAIGADLASLRRSSRYPRIAAHWVFAQLFLVLPAMVYVSELEPNWIRYAASLAGSTVLTVLAFHLAHRRLFPGDGGDRWVQNMLMLAPPSAIRAHDRLGRRMFVDRHPLAVARVVCRPAELETFARRALLDLRAPVAPVCPLEDAAAIAVEADFRARVLRAVERSIAEAGLDVTALAKAPERSDPGSVAFCPRCRAEFAKVDAQCESCGGLALTAF